MIFIKLNAFYLLIAILVSKARSYADANLRLERIGDDGDTFTRLLLWLALKRFKTPFKRICHAKTSNWCDFNHVHGE